MKLASHTSGTVITMLVASLPLAARRLGDADLLRQFMGLIHQLAGKAPRGLRPMMEVLDELLSKLTLGGLRRWALWGAQAHARDLDGQMAYFGLADRLVKGRVPEGAARHPVRRQPAQAELLPARALGPGLLHAAYRGRLRDAQGPAPFIEDHFIHVPDAFDDYHGIKGLDMYRATVAHCAAHLAYTTKSISAEQLTPVHMKLIGLFEDARVEHLAAQEFPGLRKLWLQFFDAPMTPQDSYVELHPMVDLMLRMAHALLDPELPRRRRDDQRACGSFPPRAGGAPARQPDQLGRRRHPLQPPRAAGGSFRTCACSKSFPIPYRDDNRYIWDFDEVSVRQPRRRLHPGHAAAGPQVRQRHRDGERGRLRARRRRRPGDLDLRHRVLPLRGRGRQLQRDVGQGARRRSPTSTRSGTTRCSCTAPTGRR